MGQPQPATSNDEMRPRGPVPAGCGQRSPAAALLDEYEISLGKWGDREALTKWLAAAREQYERAAVTLNPIVAESSRHEESLLAAGIWNFLIGESLVRAADPEALLGRLLGSR